MGLQRLRALFPGALFPAPSAAALAVGCVLAGTCAFGCVPEAEPEGVGGYCHRDEQCLEGLRCVELSCRAGLGPTSDAGPPAETDAGAPVVDASTPDAGSEPDVDAGIDAGPPPVDSGSDAAVDDAGNDAGNDAAVSDAALVDSAA